MATAITNTEATVAVLEKHREARAWSDSAVATDLLKQLGLDPKGEAKHAAPVINPDQVTVDEVTAAEDAAKKATDKAKALRAALTAQDKPKSPTEVPTATLPTPPVPPQQQPTATVTQQVTQPPIA